MERPLLGSIDAGGFEANRLVTVGLGQLDAAIPVAVFDVAAAEPEGETRTVRLCRGSPGTGPMVRESGFACAAVFNPLLVAKPGPPDRFERTAMLKSPSLVGGCGCIDLADA